MQALKKWNHNMIAASLYVSFLLLSIWPCLIPGQNQNQNFKEKPNIEDVACGLELPKNSANEDNQNCFWHFFVGWHQISSSKSTSKSDLSISILLISELRALETPAFIHRLGFSILPWQFHARRMLQVITRYHSLVRKCLDICSSEMDPTC